MSRLSLNCSKSFSVFSGGFGGAAVIGIQAAVAVKVMQHLAGLTTTQREQGDANAQEPTLHLHLRAHILADRGGPRSDAVGTTCQQRHLHDEGCECRGSGEELLSLFRVVNL